MKSGISLDNEESRAEFEKLASTIRSTPVVDLQSQFRLLDGASSYLHASWNNTTGVISPLAIDGKDPEGIIAETPERLTALRVRLSKLGYYADAGKRTSNAPMDDRLRTALITFQKECNLQWQNGILTVETWDNLQELFSFEDPLNTERWFNDGLPEKPLIQAANLRLKVLGFGSKEGTTPYVLNVAGLHSFMTAIERLGADTSNLPIDALTEISAGWLFDFDKLSQLLAHHKQTETTECIPFRTLLINVGLIELWLAGYEVKLAADISFLVAPTRGKGDWNMKVFKRFLYDHKYANRELYKQVKDSEDLYQVVPAMLTLSEQLRTSAEASSAEEDVIGRVREKIERNSNGKYVWRKICGASKKAVSCLFDGIRRAVMWLKNMAIKIWEKITGTALATIYKMWRIIYHFAGGAALYFRKMMTAFKTGIRFVFNKTGVIFGDSVIHRHDADFDFCILVNKGASISAIEHATAILEVSGKCVGISGKCIAFILNTALSIAKIISRGAVLWLYGFYTALMCLAEAYRRIKEIVRALDAIDVSVLEIQEAPEG